MSRVYEALQKANLAKKNGEAKSVVTAPTNGSSIASSAVEAYAPSSETGLMFPENGSAANGHAKSWRLWLEELAFGWDLRRYKNYPIISLEKESPAAEQYKILREQLKRMRSERGMRLFALTSAVKQDGKTMVSVNLAAAIALGFEEQVLLIDADLRSPDVHHYFGLPRGPGLTDYLTSTHGKIDDYVRETFLPGLKILTAGSAFDLTSELLAKERMKTLMAEIRAAFPEHQILIDTSPMLSTADPMILSREVEGVIVVVRAGKTPRNNLLKAIQDLNSDKIVGIVLNGAELGTFRKYYHYYSSSSS